MNTSHQFSSLKLRVLLLNIDLGPNTLQTVFNIHILSLATFQVSGWLLIISSSSRRVESENTLLHEVGWYKFHYKKVIQNPHFSIVKKGVFYCDKTNNWLHHMGRKSCLHFLLTFSMDTCHEKVDKLFNNVMCFISGTLTKTSPGVTRVLST